MSKIALITGASSGIGRAIAYEFAKNGINLILCGRREDRLIEIQEEIGDLVETTILLFDVRKNEEVETALNSLLQHWKKVDILVNNAGNAHGLGPIQIGNLTDWDAMIDGNVKGLLYVSKIVMQWMIDQNKGHIFNISSIAGKQTYPNGNVYCASKAAVEAISDSMRIDLNPHNIKVSNIAPGAVETEFSLVRFKGDANRATAVYQGFTPLHAQDIAETVYFIASRPAHVQIADVLILPTAQASTTVLKRNL